jgi:predicted nuclease of predicted toxin-antitoxin system
VSVSLYMDEHFPRPITSALRQRGADVLTVQEDGKGGTSDPLIIDRATLLNRVAVTDDKDFLIEADRRQRIGEPFSGVIFVKINRITIRRCIDDLELICAVGEAADYSDRVEYLPL